MNKTAEIQMQNANNLYERRNAKDKKNTRGGKEVEAQCVNGGHVSRHNLVNCLPSSPPVALPVEALFHSQYDQIFRSSKSKVISSTLLDLQIFL